MTDDGRRRSKSLRRFIPVVAMLAAIGISGSPSTSASEEDFLIAIQTPGAILPIAAYVKGAWTSVWHESYGDIDEPLPALRDVPVAWLGRTVPRRWSVQLNPVGQEDVIVNALERQGCQGPAYILVKPIRYAPHGAVDTMHFGLATAPQRRTLPIARESIDQPLASVRNAITRAALSLGGSKPVLHWLIRAVGSKRNVLYFETREGRSGDLERPGIVAGWLEVDGPRPRTLHVQKDVCGNEEMATLPCVIPIGVIPFDDHDVWVLEFPTGEAYGFELWRVDDHAAREILDFDAGGC